MRLDIELLLRGMVRSRSQAGDEIKRGRVLVNGEVSTKPSQLISENDTLELAVAERFVSRAGEKLHQFLASHQIEISGTVCLDIGASTGGFTDCLLRHGAKQVVAVDVGRGQFDRVLGHDPRVIVYEEQDIRTFQSKTKFDMVVCDVSFISVTEILPAIKKFLRNDGLAILLIKPQFQVGKRWIGKNGIVKTGAPLGDMLQKVCEKIKTMGAEICVFPEKSPITGQDGNQEYLTVMRLLEQKEKSDISTPKNSHSHVLP